MTMTEESSDLRRFSDYPPMTQEDWAMMAGTDEPTLGEVSRQVQALRRELHENLERMQASMASVVYRDVFEAQLSAIHASLTAVQALFTAELATRDAKIVANTERADAAKAAAMWAMGLVATLVIGAVVAGIVALLRIH